MRSDFPGASYETYAPVWTWLIVDWLPNRISLNYMFLVEAWIASAVIYRSLRVYHLGVFVLFSRFLRSRATLKPVLWPRTWLCELMWEQQQVHAVQLVRGFRPTSQFRTKTGVVCAKIIQSGCQPMMIYNHRHLQTSQTKVKAAVVCWRWTRPNIQPRSPTRQKSLLD